MRLFTISVLTILLIFTAMAARAATQATVRLRDGTTVQGSYAGGDKGTVRVAVNGAIRELPVTDIRSIVFTGQPADAHRSRPDSVAPFDGPILPRNTIVTVQLAQPISTAISTDGTLFMAVLAESIRLEDEVVLRKGATVQGRVLESRRGGPARGDARLILDLTGVKIPGHQLDMVTERWVYTPMGREAAKAADSLSYVTQAGQISIPAGARLEFRLAQPLALPAK